MIVAAILMFAVNKYVKAKMARVAAEQPAATVPANV
jgi:hypothetical protein